MKEITSRRGKLALEVLSAVLGTSIEKIEADFSPDRFWSYSKTHFFTMSKKLCFAITERPHGGEVDILVICKSLEVIKRDLEEKKNTIFPDAVCSLVKNADKTIKANLSGENSNKVDLMLIGKHGGKIVLDMLEQLINAVVQENLKIKKQKK